MTEFKFDSIDALEDYINKHSTSNIDEVLAIFREHKRLIDELNYQKSLEREKYENSFKYKIEGFDQNFKTFFAFVNEEDFDETLQKARECDLISIKNQITGEEISFKAKFIDEVSIKKIRREN